MKRKLFTLLLAIGLLTAFQTNAQTRVRFLVDSSGLAKTSLNEHDSFPQVKRTGLFNWLSYSAEGKTYLNTGTAKKMEDAKDSIQIQKDLLGDKGSVFNVKFFGKDSTQFQIIPKDATDPVELKHTKGSTSLFSILKLNSAGDKKGDGVLANFPKEWPTAEGDTIAGYLAYVPDPTKLKLDTLDVSVGLVGFDKDKKELSIKYFNEFAFYADTLPYKLQSFQFGDDTGSRKFNPGKAYETDSFPYFQIYDNDRALLKTSKNWTEEATFEGGEAINWGHRNDNKPNPNDSVVYSWLDIKLDGDAVILPGYKKDGSGDSSAVVRLDTLHRWVDSIRKVNSYDDSVGFYTTYLHRDSISKWAASGETGDSSHVYLKNDNGQLSFTVKLKNDKKVSDWTNGYPTPFDFKGNSVYYRVDTMLKWVLRPVFQKLFGDASADSIFNPSKSWQVARYVYKNGDNWRPLYVKANQVNDDEKAKKYEYITAERLREEKLLDVNVTPEVVITGLDNKYISAGKEKISLTDVKGASFKISLADTIKQTEKKWFVFNTAELYPNNKKKEFEIEDSVELFTVSDGNGLLLTVSEEKPVFEEPLKNSLTWADTLKDDEISESVRQLFAIVRDYNDGNFTFLPVAVRNWTDDTKADTLSFNLAIGRDNKDGQLVSLEGAWHLESSLSYKLVVADSVSKTESLKFKLTSPFDKWTGATGYVTVKNANENKYYRGYDSEGTEKVTKNDIAAQWTVEPKEGETWKFTPVFEDKEENAISLARADKVQAFINKDDSKVYLEWKEDDVEKKDTVLIETGYAPEDFDLYRGFDFDWKNNKGLVTIESSGKYLSYDAENAVSYETADDSPAITVYRSEEDDETLINATYKVPYYRFSYTKDADTYYLKAGDDGKISWEKTATPEGAHKFYLPAAHTEGKFYLHNHKGHLVQVSKDGSKLSLDNSGDIYSTVNAINDATEDQPATLRWTITQKGELKDTWAVVNPEFFDEDGTATGVLVIGGAGETFIGIDRSGKGVLSGEKNSSVVLKLKAVTPVPQSIVAYSPLKATAETDVKVGYNIIHDDLYLTDKETATFSEANASEKQTFAFKNNEDDDEFAIVLYDNADRFLSSAGLNLKFSDNATEKLSFTWDKPEDHGIVTGIKVIGASSAKVYGVAGGVKIVNASGAVSVYTVDGRLVTMQAVTSPDQTVAVPAGIYIVKNGANVAKVVVK